jgi:hypothetical protein
MLSKKQQDEKKWNITQQSIVKIMMMMYSHHQNYIIDVTIIIACLKVEFLKLLKVLRGVYFRSVHPGSFFMVMKTTAVHTTNCFLISMGIPLPCREVALIPTGSPGFTGTARKGHCVVSR